MNTSDLFKLNWRDVAKGVVVAIFAGALLPLLAAIQSPTFNFATADWSTIISLAVNGGLAGFAGYIAKNFFSDSEGRVGGVV